MSLKLNIASTYISQFYNAFIGIIVMPIFLLNMGAESYALISLFTLCQLWFSILDAGISQTISRETALYFSGNIGKNTYIKIYKGLHIVFIFISFLFLILLLINSGVISEYWFTDKSMSNNSLSYILNIIFICVFFRCLGGLYRGVINGSEKIIWLSNFNILISTLRFVLVIPYLYFTDFNIINYFEYQLVIAIFEYFSLFFKKNKILPKCQIKLNYIECFKRVFEKRKFIFNIGFSSTVWLMISQSDKIFASKFLSLENYGYFSIGIMIASIILISSAPISSSILPRFTSLFAQAREKEAIKIYLYLTTFICFITTFISLNIILNLHEILLVWMGNSDLFNNINIVVIYYTMGNFLLALSNLCYYLQYSIGNLKSHMFGNIILLILVVPTMFITMSSYGKEGMAIAWFIINLLWFIFWPLYIHNKLFKGLYRKWITEIIRCFIYLCIANLIVFFIIKPYFTFEELWIILLYFLYIFLFNLIACFFIFPSFYLNIKSYIRKFL